MREVVLFDMALLSAVRCRQCTRLGYIGHHSRCACAKTHRAIDHETDGQEIAETKRGGMRSRPFGITTGTAVFSKGAVSPPPPAASPAVRQYPRGWGL